MKHTVEEQERAIDELTQELYGANRQFTPRYPWLLVRVLTREQKTASGLVLPATEQNKVIHEGIVLSVWKSFRQEVTRRKDGREFTRVTLQQSQLSPGDHVIFPNWAGLPVAGFSERRYRIVKECDWLKDTDGGVMGVIDYDEPDTQPVAKLRQLIADTLDPGPHGSTTTTDPQEFSLLAAKIEEQFLLLDRDKNSVTLSGR